MDHQPAPFKSFEAQVGQVFQALGYTVIPQFVVKGRPVDWLVERNLRPDTAHRILVECRFHSNNEKVTSTELTDFANIVSIARHEGSADSGMIVTNTAFTDPAKRDIDSPSLRVRALTFEELNAELFDSRSYLRRSLPIWQTDAPLFVDGRGYSMTAKSTVNSVQEFLFQESTLAASQYVALIGGIGSGKTTQVTQLAAELALAHLRTGGLPVPILIPLERYEVHRSRTFFDQFVVRFLRDFHGLDALNWIALKHQLDNRRVALILDGFDEIVGLTNSSIMRRELEHIVATVGPASKILITCRSNLLGSAHAFTEFFRGPFDLVGSETPPQVLRLHGFSNNEIRLFLGKSGISRPKAEFITSRLHELLRRPLMLTLIANLEKQGIPYLAPTSAQELLDRALVRFLRYREDLYESSTSTSTCSSTVP